MRKTSNKQAIIWDYDTEKLNLRDPRVKLWYLNRKLKFGDFSGITKNDLRKYLPELEISVSLKELIANYLETHG